MNKLNKSGSKGNGYRKNYQGLTILLESVNKLAKYIQQIETIKTNQQI